MTSEQSGHPSLVPSPVEKRIITIFETGKNITDEQQQRIRHWLQANEIEPARVALDTITVEYNVRPRSTSPGIICFTEYYLDSDGHKIFDIKAHEAAKFLRHVEQKVEIDPDPHLSAAIAEHEARVQQVSGGG
ncbi:hypothetical protein ACFV2X_37930 [Streptomyces sp. NPDC059679]|uniref:hypothetical protein n=1 Tax=Streptomyces sp. NPDC059679 TaxID=3346903 RepID=UPI003674DDE3